MQAATTTETNHDTTSPEEVSMQVRPQDRPLLRRDVLVGQTRDGAFLRTADDAFALRGASIYRWVTALAAAMDGRATVEELSAGLTDAQADMVTRVVQVLYDRGFARPVAHTRESGLDGTVRARFAEQIRYVEHFVDDPEARFVRFRDSAVLLLAGSQLGAAVASVLGENGLAELHVDSSSGIVVPEHGGTRLRTVHDAARTVASYDMVIASSDLLSLDDLHRVAVDAEAAGVPLLPVVVIGERVYVGPLVRGATGAGWRSFLAALTRGLEPQDAAALWQGLAGSDPVTSRQVDGPHLAGMLGGQIAFEVFRERTRCLPPETDGSVLVQNTLTLDSVVEPVLPHRSDPWVPEPEHLADLTEALERLDDVQLGDVEPVEDADAHSGAATYRDLVGRHLGLVRDFPDLEIVQSPLKIGIARAGGIATTPAQAPGVRDVVGVDIFTPMAARRRAVLAAASAYASTTGPGTSEVYDVPPTVDADRLVTRSGLVEAEDRESVRAVDLSTREVELVPVHAVFPGRPGHAGVLEETEAGRGAGLTLGEALAQGVLSLSTFVAVQAAVRGAPVRRVDVGAADGTLRFLLRSAGHLGLDVSLRDVSLPGSAATVVAVDEAAPAGERSWAAASGVDGVQAAVLALRELVGARQTGRADVEHDGVGAAPVLLAAEPGGWPADDRTVALRDIERPGSMSALLAAMLRSARLLVVETTTPDLAAAGLRSLVLLGADHAPQGDLPVPDRPSVPDTRTR